MRITRTKHWILGTAISACVSVTGIQSAEAKTFDGHRLTYGVVNQEYWLDSTAVANNESAIIAGVGKWNATASPFDFSRTSVKANSHIDFYRQADDDWFCAGTQYYVSTTRLDIPPSQNWWWAKVTTRPQLKTNPYSCGEASHRDGMLAHEVGHAIGLDHVNSPSQLMYVDIGITAVEKPQPGEVADINSLY